MLYSPKQLFDPQVNELRALLDDSFFPIRSLQGEDTLLVLRNLGMQSSLEWSGVMQCAHSIADSTEDNQKIINTVSQKKKEVQDLIDQLHLGVFENTTGKTNEEQEILNEILHSKFKNSCTRLDNLTISEILPLIKCCNISICNDSSFSHLSSALGVKTITLMADTPLIYGNYSTKMFPVIPEFDKSNSNTSFA